MSRGRFGLVTVTLLGACLGTPGIAQATTNIYLCVPPASGGGVTSGGNTSGKCGTNKEVQLPGGQAEQETLIAILPHMKYEASGVGGLPTIKFEEVNVQIVSGAGKETSAPNSMGNLVIGYDEKPGTQTGSNNLILGSEQEYKSYGGILAGSKNAITGPYASITGGLGSEASGEYSSITGGEKSTASGVASSIGGGHDSTASGRESSVSGGAVNVASAEYTSISGGERNKASKAFAWVGGGFENIAEGEYSSVFGGKGNVATKIYEAIP